MKSELKKYDNLNADDAQFISDIKAIVYTAKQKAYQAADLFQVAANWLVGKRIIEQEQHGRERAEYGKRIIELASEALTAEYGKGYSATTLRNFRKFYLAFRGLQIQQAVVAEFKSCFLNQQPLLAESPTTQNQEALRKISNVGNSESISDTLVNWQELYPVIDELYDCFHTKLLNDYPGVFSEREIQILCLLRADFSTKEIGVLIQQTSNSVYVSKTSIRKKLNLPPKDDFIAFLTGSNRP